MTTRRRSPRGRGRSARKPLSWTNNAFTFNLGIAGVLVFAELTPTTIQTTGTVLRTIMTVTAMQIAAVANVPQEYALAMYVQTQQAIDNLEILAPLSTLGQNQDWYYWTGRATFLEAAGGPNDQFAVDIKSSRKLRQNFGLVLVAEPVGANTSAVDLVVGIRQLWQLA